ncbi:CHAT domain-containing protein [Azospirillum sp.]|uniref:CHAT domain-containing protein n=1 Tax=Azospirillum sp. TaxID=34012 RepID=UPI002D63C79E|nr:tetratricopeptide repeat protein [Azospirillum sp.]HYD69442.1 tetratricopeptide repeat protein [Azospirillum sp.]
MSNAARDAARHLQEGRPAEAEALLRRLASQRPRDGDVLHLLGLAVLHQGRGAEAADLLRRAAGRHPDDAVVHSHLGVALKAAGRLDERITAYRTAVRLDPAQVRAWANLGAALLEADNADGAEEALAHALALAPDDAEALAGMGDALRRLGRPDAALACLTRALAARPGFAEAAVTLGLLLEAEGCRPEADTAFARALASDPGHALAHWNRGLLRLGGGDLAEGWAGYGWRFSTPALHRPRPFAEPEWRGEDVSGRRVLVWREQGLGDELMFASLYPDLIRHAGQVVIECDRRLVPLFTRSFPGAAVVAAGGPLPPVDCHIPAGSLPRWLRPGLAAFPASPGFLVPDASRVGRWRRELAALGAAPKVGLAWRSGLATRSRAAAYAPLDLWAPMLTVPGLTFVPLQYDRCAAACAAAERRFGIRLPRWPDLDLKDDLEEVAALMAALDLVVAAPTAVGELAAAVGVPTWRLAPGGDWSALGTAARPWFPAQRLFQPRPGEGLANVLARVGAELAALQRR